MAKKCSIAGCENLHKCKGYCSAHYNRFWKYGDPKADIPLAKKRGGSKPKYIGCLIEECDRSHSSLGYCALHWKRFHLYGDPHYTQNGPRGQGSINGRGYRVFCIGGKSIKEHTMVMEKKLGRKLLPNENVHHINGVKTDNRPENLELWVKSQPSGQRAKDLVHWAKEILAQYEGELHLLNDSQMSFE